MFHPLTLQQMGCIREQGQLCAFGDGHIFCCSEFFYPFYDHGKTGVKSRKTFFHFIYLYSAIVWRAFPMGKRLLAGIYLQVDCFSVIVSLQTWLLHFCQKPPHSQQHSLHFAYCSWLVILRPANAFMALICNVCYF